MSLVEARTPHPVTRSRDVILLVMQLCQSLTGSLYFA